MEPLTPPGSASPQRFALLDRDGTLIVHRHYLSTPEEVELIPGAALGLRALGAAGLGLIVVTNQSGIARGYFDESTLDRINARMTALFAAEGVRFDAIYHCPHAPEDACECRKPRTGLVTRAAAAHHFDPRQSFVIGDNLVDLELGRNLGATTILVKTGYGESIAARHPGEADHVAGDVQEAATLIARLIRLPVTDG